jgi:hypothetical protein
MDLRTWLGVCVTVAFFPACSDSMAPSREPDGGTTDRDARSVARDGSETPADGGSKAAGLGACSTRETIAENVASAENLLFTTTGRLFVSGDDGIFELTISGGAAPSLRTIEPKGACRFAGMVQLGDVIYANCYDLTDSSLFAAKLMGSPQFSSIYALPGEKLANGMTADPEGHLFVTSTFGDKIFRLTPDPGDPMSIAEKVELPVPAEALLPNGIKYLEKSLYFTSNGDLWNLPADATSGTQGTRLVAGSSYLDDLSVDASGIVVADFAGGALRSFDLTGKPTAATLPMLLGNPSSVLPAKGRLGFANNDWIATDKSANSLAVVHACAP